MAHQLVLCDLGGVVVEVESDRLVHQVAQLTHRSADEVYAAIYREDLLLPFELGRISPRAYYEGLKEALPLPWSYEQFMRAWNGILQESPRASAILPRLRRRHTLIALSNTNVLHLQQMQAAMPGLSLFHAWVASCEVGMRKPDPEIYRLALSRARVRAHEAVYIDDRPEMVEAGRRLGLTAIRFETDRQLEEELRALGINV